MAKDQGPGTSREAWEMLNPSEYYVLNWLIYNCASVREAREPHFVGTSLPEITHDYASANNINSVLEKLWSKFPIVRRIKLLPGSGPYSYYVSFEEFSSDLTHKVKLKQIHPRKLKSKG